MIELFKKIMPKISDTERVALECGTVSIDGDIFAGNYPTVSPTCEDDLTREERIFLDCDVPELIKLHESRGYTHDNDLHPDVWQHLKENKFFAMIIPTEYGGLGFTPTAQSLVVSKLSSAGFPALAVTVMVPNSLGPGELLLHYGTSEQKDKYLPQLASGDLIPCFGLTGLHNGSDATTHIDTAHVSTDDSTGDVTYTVTLNKRYITLAPVAGLIGLAVKVNGAITLFLVERDHPGLEIGDRHNPMGQPFMNGTIKGTITLTNKHILGGEAMLGQGWRMLVECLSVGRAISLPALGTASAARCALAAGAYSRARQQFGLKLHQFEAIQEQLAEIAYHSYLTYSVQQTINGELQRGESPSALSAMWKYQSTERSRKAINATMDILAGAAIQQGPKNVIAEVYKSIPIAITVEGANILSRSLVTFGGGLMRSHPHLKNLVDAVHNNNEKQLVSELVNIVRHTLTNFAKSIAGNKNALFAFTANMVLTLGKKYKTSEYISSRMADIFSIRVFEAAIHAQPDSDLKRYVLKRLHNEEVQAYQEVIAELPKWNRVLIKFAKLWRLSSQHIGVVDNRSAANEIVNKSLFVEKLMDYVYLDKRLEDLVSMYYTNIKETDIIEVDSYSPGKGFGSDSLR